MWNPTFPPPLQAPAGPAGNATLEVRCDSFALRAREGARASGAPPWLLARRFVVLCRDTECVGGVWSVVLLNVAAWFWRTFLLWAMAQGAAALRRFS